MRQNWSQVSEVEPVDGAALLHMGPFYSLLVAIYKHAKVASSPLQPECMSSTCLITLLEHSFPAYRGGKCGCDSVEQCVLTIPPCIQGMSSRKSSQLDDLLMYCDSCCQQFNSTLSACNFQPSSLHYYCFKSLLTKSHTEAARLIVCSGFQFCIAHKQWMIFLKQLLGQAESVMNQWSQTILWHF